MIRVVHVTPQAGFQLVLKSDVCHTAVVPADK